MATVSSKRQITLPKSLCDRLGVGPGDEVDLLEYGGRITVLKRIKGASAGVLKQLQADKRYTDEESLRSALEAKGVSKGKGKDAA